MEVAALARMFPGRFVPAAGHGVLAWMDQVGAGVRSPMTLLLEWVTAVRSLLNGETVTVSGQYVRLDDVALDWPPQAVPPLLIGARGPRTIALAGEIADGLVLDAGITPDGVRRAVAMAAAARPHEVVVYLLCAAGPGAKDRAEAELAAAPPQPANPSPAAPAECAAVGSAADVAHIIGTYARAGATTVVLQPTADDPDVTETIKLAGQARTALHADR
jgi:alkanesulfonate monooxygenase SsuD/methylene tetrahydromethanopterin reductase-like flavin-dependent oxidoreductase (luciferase family)